MDRDRAREDLVLALVESKASAAFIRARLDSSAFAEHTALVMLVADHDLHRPHAPSQGPGRRDSLLDHLAGLLAAERNRTILPRTRAGLDRDPRWALAHVAHADLAGLADRRPSATDLEALLAAFEGSGDQERRPDVPGPVTRDRRRRRRDT
ncbi:MAG: hypothetical protein KQH57_08310 [Actinomycetales bacterium]|nr:hypothetical protein [Actinomycetales bacterium]